MATYFLEPVAAYKQAKKKLRAKPFNEIDVCYYDGEEIQTDLDNLIHLPLENIYDFMCETPYPPITTIVPHDIHNEKFNREVQQYIDTAQAKVIIQREEFVKLYKQEIQKIKLDFSEPLRVFFISSRLTRVLQHSAFSLMQAFEELGYETFFSREPYETQRWGINQDSGYFAWHLKNMLEFKPHITINLDYLHNDFLPQEMFNFVWFQDPMPPLTTNEKAFIRKRDYIFYLTRGLGGMMNGKDIRARYQPFAININIYKKYPEIKKEKKIVFIGSSYKARLHSIKKHKNFKTIYEELIKLFVKNSYIDVEHNIEIKQLTEKYSLANSDIYNIWSYLERDYAVEILCTINTNYKIEIYGSGWEDNSIVAPFSKGMINYGEDISKIYNSATYGYCPGGYVLMQRTLECACSGTTPLVLDVRKNRADTYDKRIEDSIEFFHLNTLKHVLKKEPIKKNFDFIREAYSYNHVVKRFIDIIHQELIYHDTYYLNGEEALKNALQNNRVLAPNKKVSALQICFYDGERIENAPQNCIYVPFENFVAYFSDTNYRIPQVIATTESFFKEEFTKKITGVELILNQKKEKLYQEIKNLEPNFKDKKLRIFAFGCRETFLKKHFMQDIIQAATTLGYETYLHTQTSELESCSQVHYLEAFKNFNPHITININEFNNHFLNDAVFNFVWFQDVVPILTNQEKHFVRKRDTIFYATQSLGDLLAKKDIQAKYQPFCINTNVYKVYPEIKKEKKIVFIGNSYQEKLDSIKEDENFKIIYAEVLKIYLKDNYVELYNNFEIQQLMKQYSISYERIYFIWRYFEKDYAIETLCLINTKYEIEIYGYGWEDNSIVAPFYKGTINYGEEISKIYNSATYGYCPGGDVLMQRTLECASSGTTPLVLDVRENKTEQYNKLIEDSMELFHLGLLVDILNEEPKIKNFDFIREEYSYTNMIKKFIDIVYQEKRD